MVLVRHRLTGQYNATLEKTGLNAADAPLFQIDATGLAQVRFPGLARKWYPWLWFFKQTPKVHPLDPYTSSLQA